MPNPRGLVIPPADIKRLIGGEAVTVYAGVVRRAHPKGETAGAVLPAHESGWVAWFPGHGDPMKLAEFTKRVYRVGFPAPFAVGEKVYVKESIVLQSDADGDDPPFNDGRPTKWFDDESAPWWLQPHYCATDPEPELACTRSNCDNEEPHCHWIPARYMSAEWARLWAVPEKIEPVMVGGKWRWRVTVRRCEK